MNFKKTDQTNFQQFITHTRKMSLGTAFFLIAVLFLQFAECLASSPNQDFLTQEERAWLIAHPTIRLGVGVSFPPYQWVEQNKNENVFKGVVSDYVKILETRLNIKMKVVYGLNFNQALELGKKKEIDLFPCLAKTPESSEFLSFTTPYISYPSVIITREDAPFIGNISDLSGKKVSLVKNQYIYSLIKRNYSHLNLAIIESENASEDLQSVSFGRAEACLMDLGVASYFIQKLRITNLKIAAPTELERVELAMGSRNDWPILQSIIEKTLNTISKEEKDSINQRWINLKYEPGIAYNIIIKWAVIIGSLILLLFTIFLWWNRSLQREIIARKKIEDERNQLIAQLHKTLQEVKTLRGFLPICSNCRKIRKDSGYWQQIEAYIQEHTDAQFTHGMCPDCMREIYPSLADKVLKKLNIKSETH